LSSVVNREMVLTSNPNTDPEESQPAQIMEVGAMRMQWPCTASTTVSWRHS